MFTQEDLQSLGEIIGRTIENSLFARQVPEFAPGSVPVPLVAALYGKDASWVRAGIVVGWLPIGIATRGGKQVTKIEEMNSKLGNINYQISPKKLYEETGYIWKGEKTLDKKRIA